MTCAPLRLRKASHGPEHPETLIATNNLAVLYLKAGEFDRAIPFLEETYKLRKAKLGREHQDTLLVMANLGVGYKNARRLAEAIPLLQEAYRYSKKYPALRFAGSELIESHVAAGHPEQAVAVVNELLGETRAGLPKDSPELAGQLASFGLSLLQAKAFAEAEPVLRECLAIREKTGADAWNTFNAKSMLGESFLGQKKYGEAEPLLLAGYEGMKAREAAIPSQAGFRLGEAVERLVRFYDATDRPEKAAEWRRKLPKTAAPAPREVR